MKIEEGKRYVREDGEISGELSQKPKTGNLYDTTHGWYYHESGSAVSRHDDGIDLISEYTDQAAKSGPNFTFQGEPNTAPPLDPEELHRRLAEPQDEFGQWRGWNGGECPVEAEIEAILLGRDGCPMVAPNPASHCWNYSKGSLKVIAYRVKKAPMARKHITHVKECGDHGLRLLRDPTFGTRAVVITIQGNNITAEWGKDDG